MHNQRPTGHRLSQKGPSCMAAWVTQPFVGDVCPGPDRQTRGVFVMLTTDLLIYKLYRSNAMWFASRVDCGHSVTVAKGKTYKFEKGEMLKWATEWMTKARKTWSELSSDQQNQTTTCRLPGVPTAIASPCGASDTATTNVPPVDSRCETDCLCPACTDKAIQDAHKRTARIYSTLAFPGKADASGNVQEADLEEHEN